MEDFFTTRQALQMYWKLYRRQNLANPNNGKWVDLPNNTKKVKIKQRQIQCKKGQDNSPTCMQINKMVTQWGSNTSPSQLDK